MQPRHREHFIPEPEASMNHFLTTLVSLFFLLLPLSSFAAGPANDIPEQLKPWVPWVLHNQEQQQFCTASADGKQRFCLWPEPLVIEVSSKGGRFSQRWTMKKEGWIVLPGTEKLWPQEVRINETAALVVSKNGHPAIHVEQPGEYTIAGRFYWKQLPEAIQVAPGTGIVQLTVDGDRRLADLTGETLWLSRAQKQDARIEDTVHLQVYRLITDSIPMLITSQIEIQVSGKPREIVLDWQPPTEQIPVSLQCNLPVKFGSDRKIHMQVRPGNYTLIYRSRPKGEVTSISFENSAQGPATEYWSFAAQNQLRMVKISGEAAAVDPAQTSIPKKWHTFPAYRVQKGQSLYFQTLKRGNPEPPPNHLSLHRTFWLDENGSGMTVQGRLEGTVHNTPRLVMQPPAQLGRMVINGRDQLITRLNEDGPAGIEVRQGQIKAMAVSRIEKVRHFPAGGWGQSISKLSGELVLPPGWTLFYASGVDTAWTWISRWTLLDCFIVLIIVISSFKLLGGLAGMTSLPVLLLSYHDPGAPIFIWLALLGCIAIIRALPSSKYYHLVKKIKLALLFVLVIIILPYSVAQLRVGFFPQLGWGGHSYSPAIEQAAYSVQKEAALPVSVAKQHAVNRGVLATGASGIGDKKRQQLSQEQFDSNAKVQSGPGVPTRRWKSVYLDWNGPVEKELNIEFFLLSPFVNLLMTLVKVVAIFLFAFFMIDFKEGGDMRIRLPTIKKNAIAALLLAAIFSGGTVPAAYCADYPDQEMLNELRTRLLEPDRCFPDCADFSEMRIDLQGNECSVRIEAAALADCAIQVPSGTGIFWHRATLDKEPSPLIVQRETLWMPVAKGRHHIVLEGRINQASVELQLPHKPHKVLFSGHQQWTVTGLDENMVPKGHRLQCVRQEEQKQSGFVASALPPLMQVERTLNLGLQWTVETVVKRLSPTGSTVFLKVPLLAGESVTNPEFQVDMGAVMINFAPNERQKRYQSTFKKQETIDLTAPATTEYYETWRLNASPVWHVETAGISPILHHAESGSWQPEWRPWPEEKLSLTVTRPAGVPGPTKTIESSFLTIEPGLRSTTMRLSFTIRSTRGDQQNITLPEDAVVQYVRVSGREQPVKKDRTVVIPLSPTSQQVEIEWRTTQGITTLFTVPKIDIGNESVNADVEIHIGNRWVWFVKGPQMGPAILFYSEILIILLVAILLGRSKLTPLRSYHWLLLGFGLCQSGLIPCLIIVAWFLALKIRKEKGHLLSKRWFDAGQIALVLLSLVAAGALVFALQNGLLGHPDMLISGNSSSSSLLRWYQARITSNTLPQPTVVSIPIMAYRITMLAWALWMALYLLRWLKWGWGCFSSEQIWQKIPKKGGSKKLQKDL